MGVPFSTLTDFRAFNDSVRSNPQIPVFVVGFINIERREKNSDNLHSCCARTLGGIFLAVMTDGSQGSHMILESAILEVKDGQEMDFESAVNRANPILARQKGHLAHRFQKCMETKGRYLLLVWWQSLDDHLEGFRNSPDYEEWRRLLHHFYDPFPIVEHYLPLGGAGRLPND